MHDRNLSLNFLSEDSYIVIPLIVIDFFKEDKDTPIVLMHLISQYKYLLKSGQLDSSGYFYSTVTALEEKYHISPYCQRRSIEKLEELNFIRTIKKGMPAKRHFKIDEYSINRVLTSSPRDIRRIYSKDEYYNSFNKAINENWDFFLTTIGNMNKQTALVCYVWKRYYEQRTNIEWNWNSMLVGIIGVWVKKELKTGYIDFNIIFDYLDTINDNNHEKIVKQFISDWVKIYIEKSIGRRLIMKNEILAKVGEYINE